MKFFEALIAAVTTIIVLIAGLIAVPFVFADHELPGLSLGSTDISGINSRDLPGVLSAYESNLRQQSVTIQLRGTTVVKTAAELGISLDYDQTFQRLSEATFLDWLQGQRHVRPALQLDTSQLSSIISTEFAQTITLPQNASLVSTATGAFETSPSAVGEGIDLLTFEQEVVERAQSGRWQTPIELTVISQSASIHEGEVEQARTYAMHILREGLTLTFQDQSWDMKPYTIKRLLEFVPQSDPSKSGNEILGVSFNEDGFREYLSTTLTPEINQEAQNARFNRIDDRVDQFEMPREGRSLNVDASLAAAQSALQNESDSIALVVDLTEPAVKDLGDIEALGIKELLATGESDFSGSPANRINNIEVGTARYHGLLIEPGQEFSFNEFLGPVDAEHGFKPELVIKQNVTTPEYGGGLCQVSTTLFRAAVYSGLEITQRRNHAYVVKYYGTPGFDSTIYPPYTDLRFINNTPGYILIQARVEGKKLFFELWGTNDGREVLVEGPFTYDRQSNGAMKARLSQTVTKDGEVMIEHTFYSNYKSADLFPHADTSSAASSTPDVSPSTSNEPTTTTTTNPSPSATSTAASSSSL